MSIKSSNLNKFSKKFNSNQKNKLAKNAVTNTPLDKVLLDRNQYQNLNEIFSKKIQINTSPTDQKNSGRCWLFAFLNVIRLNMIKRYKLSENFQLSQTYLYFYDKLEKSNFFLNNIIKTKNLDINDEYIRILLQEPVSDGGQWNMLVNLINKYGIIPKDNMKETYQSEHSGNMNKFLNSKLREFALKIRNHKNNKFTNLLKDMLSEIYKILVIFLGEPPKHIKWQYYKNKKKTHKKTNMLTPLQFYKKYTHFNANKYVCLINVPLKTKPYYNLYNIKYFGNVLEGNNTNYVNIPIKIMKQLVEKSINNNEAVWFGCDVGQYYSRELGILDTEAFNFNTIFDTDINLNKGDKLLLRDSAVTHAMVIKGFNKDKKNIDRWLVENSWGKNTGTEGNFIMSDTWFDNYVYEIVINKKYLDKKILDVLDKEPILLEPWDPIGNLLF